MAAWTHFSGVWVVLRKCIHSTCAIRLLWAWLSFWWINATYIYVTKPSQYRASVEKSKFCLPSPTPTTPTTPPNLWQNAPPHPPCLPISWGQSRKSLLAWTNQILSKHLLRKNAQKSTRRCAKLTCIDCIDCIYWINCMSEKSMCYLPTHRQLHYKRC